MSNRPNENLTGERLYALRCELLFALPKDQDPQNIFDTANMMLIPQQRCEHVTVGMPLIDYSFDGEPIRMTVPKNGYNYSAGFATVTDGVPASSEVTSYIHERQAPRSADELEQEYSPNGEHPVFTRNEWRVAVHHCGVLLGYWQWLADRLEEVEDDL